MPQVGQDEQGNPVFQKDPAKKKPDLKVLKEEKPGQSAAAFEYALSETDDVADMGCIIPCPLPGYRHIRVLFRTNIPYKVRRFTPEYDARVLKRANDASNRLRDAEVGSDAHIEAREELAIAADERDADYAEKWAKWVSLFVRKFDGWAFKVNGQAVPEPDPLEPETYLVIKTEMEDFAKWLEGDGYRTALEKSQESFLSPSENPSSE